MRKYTESPRLSLVPEDDEDNTHVRGNASCFLKVNGHSTSTPINVDAGRERTYLQVDEMK